MPMALGSSLGLAGFLRKKGHSVSVVTPATIRNFLTWMPGSQTVIALSKKSKESELKSAAAFSERRSFFARLFQALAGINDLGDMGKALNGRER